MACPNKDKDARIIAEVERRKSVKAADPIPEVFDWFEGEISDVLNNFPHHEILKIERHSTDVFQWKITLNNSLL